MTNLLDIKKKLKAKRPRRFTRADTPGKKRLPKRQWRRPKGLHGKVKDQRRGHKAMPNVGYGSPKALRHTDSNGLLLVRVSSMDELLKIDKDKHMVILSGTIGKRKRMDLLNKASALGVRIKGVKDLKAAADKIVADKKARQDVKKQKLQTRKQKREQKQKVKTQKESLQEKAQAKQTPQTKEEEKKELDKLLTQKE